MTSERLGEMFKGDSAYTWARKFPLVSMGGRANGQVCADGEQDPHRRERNFLKKYPPIYKKIIFGKHMHAFFSDS
jgi:hypothetical protein